MYTVRTPRIDMSSISLHLSVDNVFAPLVPPMAASQLGCLRFALRKIKFRFKTLYFLHIGIIVPYRYIRF